MDSKVQQMRLEDILGNFQFVTGQEGKATGWMAKRVESKDPDVSAQVLSPRVVKRVNQYNLKNNHGISSVHVKDRQDETGSINPEPYGYNRPKLQLRMMCIGYIMNITSSAE